MRTPQIRSSGPKRASEKPDIFRPVVFIMTVLGGVVQLLGWIEGPYKLIVWATIIIALLVYSFPFIQNKGDRILKSPTQKVWVFRLLLLLVAGLFGFDLWRSSPPEQFPILVGKVKFAKKTIGKQPAAVPATLDNSGHGPSDDTNIIEITDHTAFMRVARERILIQDNTDGIDTANPDLNSRSFADGIGGEFFWFDVMKNKTSELPVRLIRIELQIHRFLSFVNSSDIVVGFNVASNNTVVIAEVQNEQINDLPKRPWKGVSSVLFRKPLQESGVNWPLNGIPIEGETETFLVKPVFTDPGTYWYTASLIFSEGVGEEHTLSLWTVPRSVRVGLRSSDDGFANRMREAQRYFDGPPNFFYTEEELGEMKNSGNPMIGK